MDQRSGQPIDRRTALSGLGTVSLAALFAACGNDADEGAATTTSAAPSDEPDGTTTELGGADDLFADGATCTLSPEQTEGPYYFDVDSIRDDLREDREGVPLRLAIRVRDAQSCDPLPNAVVDLWHCDALGDYSGFDGAVGQTTYLRGAQVTDGAGVVRFVTVYPGWYRGRTPHIHAKVHLDRTTLLTSQLYFDEHVTDAVYTRAPYDRRADRDATNASDRIFDERLVMTVSPDGDGYLGVMSFDVQR